MEARVCHARQRDLGIAEGFARVKSKELGSASINGRMAPVSTLILKLQTVTPQ
jgi:hypothetical protein